ncbi:hypothetical protein WJX74_005137 [Apatococcus lobatus]|uniref:Alpha 1,4-glycosyltransferase domain-containing protein n=2 Tax=Apatococcus TaxID=904362 RepID=A0AAW1RAB2_9CHLO
MHLLWQQCQRALLLSLLLLRLFAAAAPASLHHQTLFVHFYDSIMDAPAHLCAIESASRLLHQGDVKVFAKDIEGFHKHWPIQLARVNVNSIDLAEIFMNTPLWEWYANNRHTESSMVSQNLSNALRLAVIWKYGGMYIDLDIIATSPLFFTAHGNLARQHAPDNPKFDYNNAVLNFPRSHPFVWRLMEEFVNGFDGFTWGENGPALITRVYNGCMADRDPVCADLEVSAAWRHSPIPYSDIPLVLQQNWMGTELWEKVQQVSWATHWYHNQFKMTNTTCVLRGSVFEKIMTDTCPVIRQVFGEQIFCSAEPAQEQENR